MGPLKALTALVISLMPIIVNATEFTGEPKHFAFIVGIEDYDKFGKLKHIPHACDDAQKVAARLRARPKIELSDFSGL